MIYNDDCFNVLPEIPDKSVDMVLCDLPYGITACKWDSVLPLDQLWDHYKRLIKPNGVILLFGTQPIRLAMAPLLESSLSVALCHISRRQLEMKIPKQR